MMRILELILPLLGWFLLWGLGGWLVVQGAFRISRNEQVPLALIVGLALENLFANMLAAWLPLPLAFWVAAGLVLALGVLLAWGIPRKELLSIPFLPGQWFALLFMFWLVLLMQRGLAIFDDYAHLPTLSRMAAGDIPPHFAFDPAVPYSYHYFLLLFGAQITRVGGLPVWAALDIARSLTFAISAVLMGTWVHRLTRSSIAGILAVLMVAFASGTRWLLLIFPRGVLEWLSGHISMIGSGRASGPDFATAMASSWALEGIGTIPFPFAFTNGIFAPGILGASGPNSLISTGLSVFFLQTFNHWRSWRGALVSTLMTASLALLTELGLVLSVVSWGGILLIYLIQHRSWKLPASLWQWLVVIALGNLLGAVQGGALTEILYGGLRELQGEGSTSYQTVGFLLSFDPVIVSSHLGVLSLFSPPQLLVALFEIGPILLVTPLLAVWGIKAYRYGRWYEAVLILSGFLTFAMVFVQFSGSTGVRNTSRLYSFLGLAAMYVVPVVWLWAARRSQTIRYTAGSLAAVLMFGGLVIFGIELTATQRPGYSYFLTELDARMYHLYWNRLDPDSLVFDPDPSRATTVLGRSTDAAYTWYEMKPQWKTLRNAPDPYHLRAAGFRYAYLDNRYLLEIDPLYPQRLGDPCVQVIEEFYDAQDNFRRLLDLDACR